uniref:Uncharacterized protein n=1 Tax=Oryza brachyantha TaxID=4533 RepID=J3MJX3_ORYBR
MKDDLNVQLDLLDIGLWQELKPQLDETENQVLPNAPFTMSQQQKGILCSVIQNLSTPFGYASNHSRCVNMNECKVLLSDDSSITKTIRALVRKPNKCGNSGVVNISDGGIKYCGRLTDIIEISYRDYYKVGTQKRVGMPRVPAMLSNLNLAAELFVKNGQQYEDSFQASETIQDGQADEENVQGPPDLDIALADIGTRVKRSINIISYFDLAVYSGRVRLPQDKAYDELANRRLNNGSIFPKYYDDAFDRVIRKELNVYEY